MIKNFKPINRHQLENILRLAEMVPVIEFITVEFDLVIGQYNIAAFVGKKTEDPFFYRMGISKEEILDDDAVLTILYDLSFELEEIIGKTGYHTSKAVLLARKMGISEKIISQVGSGISE